MVIDRTYLYANLAAAYALDGQLDDAKSALAEACRLNPNLTVIVTAICPFAERAEGFEGLRKRGCRRSERHPSG